MPHSLRGDKRCKSPTAFAKRGCLPQRCIGLHLRGPDWAFEKAWLSPQKYRRKQSAIAPQVARNLAPLASRSGRQPASQGASVLTNLRALQREVAARFHVNVATLDCHVAATLKRKCGRAHLEDCLILSVEGDLIGLEDVPVFDGLLHLSGHGDGEVLSHLE